MGLVSEGFQGIRVRRLQVMDRAYQLDSETVHPLQVTDEHICEMYPHVAARLRTPKAVQEIRRFFAGHQDADLSFLKDRVTVEVLANIFLQCNERSLPKALEYFCSNLSMATDDKNAFTEKAIECQKKVRDRAEADSDVDREILKQFDKESQQIAEIPGRLVQNSQSTRALHAFLGGDFRILLALDDEALDLLKNHHLAGACPVIDALKDKKCFKTTIGEVTFDGQSKGALTVHDFFDHICLIFHIEAAGLLEKHQAFFDAIGHPENYDLFSLHGEVIASIAYDWRAWISGEKNPHQRYSYNFLDFIREELQHDQTPLGHLLDQEAKDFFLGIEANSPLADQVEFMLAGIHHEFEAMSIKFGRIQLFRTQGFEQSSNPKRDETLQPEHRSLKVMNPLFLNFFVDVLNILNDPQNQMDTVLRNIHVNFEDALLRVAKDPTTKAIELSRTIFEAPAPDCQVSSLTQRWIADNLGHMAFRFPLCGQ